MYASRTTASRGNGYCEATNLTFTGAINVSFRATNNLGTTTGEAMRYIHDAT